MKGVLRRASQQAPVGRLTGSNAPRRHSSIVVVVVVVVDDSDVFSVQQTRAERGWEDGL